MIFLRINNRPVVRSRKGGQIHRRLFQIKKRGSRIVCWHAVSLSAMLDRELQTLAEGIRVTNHQPIRAGASQRFLIVERAAQRKREPPIPSSGNVIPAAIEKIFRARAVNREFPVESRFVVAFKKQSLPGL